MTYGPAMTLWRTVTDVDFTALSAQDLKAGGDGVKTIAGMVWTLVNSANASAINLIPGTGLVFVCNTAASVYQGGTRTSPMVTLSMFNAFNFYNLKDYCVQSHIVRVMARLLLTNAGADFENGLLGVEDSVTPTGQNFGIGKGHNGANNVTAFGTAAGTTTTVYQDIKTFTDDVLGFTLEDPDLAEFWSGTFDTAAGRLPYEFDTHRDSFSSNLPTPLFRLKTNPQLFLAAETGNASGDLTVTFTHFRVDVASKSPPR